MVRHAPFVARSRASLTALLLAGSGLAPASAHAQLPAAGSAPAPPTPAPSPYGYAQPYPGYLPAASSRARSSLEISLLYAASAVYGAGVGIWFSSEVGISDPGVYLIPPALLGVAGPATVFFLDHPNLPRGLPAAVASGLVLGAGEGLGIASYQFVHASARDAWGPRGFSRAMVLGATLGGVGGALVGYYQEPSPRSSLLATSSVVWGGAIGAMFGYGASSAGIGYGRANDSAALGGLVGYNVALGASAALSTVYIPSYETIGYMWIGGGLGALVSLPVFLFYTGKNSPPAKRGLLFSATATTLGIAAGALFGASNESASAEARVPRFAHIDYVLPLLGPAGPGLAFGGTLE